MAEAPVFYDPSGRRRRVSIVVATSLAIVASTFALVLAFAAILASPQLPNLRVAHRSTTYQDPVTISAKGGTILTPRARKLLLADVRRHQLSMRKSSEGTIVVGYYNPYESAGLASFNSHARALTHFVPQWLHLSAHGDSFELDSAYEPKNNPKTLVLQDIARQNGVRIVPMLDNYGLERFDRKRSSLLLRDEAVQRRLADQLAAFLLSRGYDGVHLDLEELNAEDDKGLVRFATVLRERFAPHHLSVSAAIEVDNEDLDVAALAEQCDWIVPMLYDQHSQDGEPGPIASLDWTESCLGKILKTVPESKVVMGVGNFGYDWTIGAKAESMTFQEALTAAAGYRSEAPEKVLKFDAGTSNTTYAYRDEEDRLHRVWYLDALSAYNQCRAAADMGIRGAAMWSLGMEDPALWSFFDRHRLFRPVRKERLEKIAFPYEVSFSGRGEIIDVARLPNNGERRVRLDEEGFVESCDTVRYASPFVVLKRGYAAKKIALTFDDGPDRQWTPVVLDVLKRLHVPATFFDIGANVEAMPDLAAREYEEGHEVGNHSFTHPDLGTVAAWRARAEIDLTQMAIEAATGHSTGLFRPPYNADSEPETPDQLGPVLQAARLGYTTVAENVDPKDWDLSVALPQGGYRPKTAQDIADGVVDDLLRRSERGDEGNIVLLHDAGGNRSQTVKALETMVPRLRALGYEFVTVSSLIHKSRNQVMPPISAATRFYYTLGRWGLGTGYSVLALLATAFTLAIALGIGRTALIVPLALAQRRSERIQTDSPLAPRDVSVVIAAYNEAAVVVRTVQSVLASDYPLREVILINDGSSDGTGDVAREAFGHDPRVKVIDKPNGGKATALNYGINLAQGDLLFHIDADTILDPAAIGRLASQFDDVQVAAVAGNVQVGNRVNLLTSWQDLEYLTSQNLDRRAYARLNCITVVPGAIGMWRRSAVVEVGGYQTDTLAEDMDLTWRLRRAGYRLKNETEAYAYTEAPENFGAFFKQRFRWAYGTLQCLVKHLGALGGYGWFGRLALPTQWGFGVVFQALAPLIDLQVMVTLIGFAATLAGAPSENQAEAVASATGNLTRVLLLYGLFLIVELIGAGIALQMERKPLRRLLPLVVQRFVYRQMMYAVMFKSLVRALSGGATGWGKLVRTGSVQTPMPRPSES